MAARLETSAPPRALYLITSSISLTLLRGQIGFLRQRGFDVYVACSPGPEVAMGSEFEGAPLLAIPMRREIAPLRDFISLWRVWRLIQQLKPDLVNVSTPKAGLLGGVAAWLARVPCRIYVMRGLRVEGATGFHRIILFATEWLACHTAQRVFCVSASLMHRAVELGVVEAERCAVLGPGSSNGVDLGALASSRANLARAAELRRQWGAPPQAPVIGFIGRCTADKGIAELIAAYSIARHRYP